MLYMYKTPIIIYITYMCFLCSKGKDVDGTPLQVPSNITFSSF